MNDQDHRTMILMKTMENVYQSVKQLRSAKGEDIHNLPASTGKTIQYLIDIGIQVGGL